MLYVISFFFLPSPKGTFSRRETNSPSGTKKTKREEKGVIKLCFIKNGKKKSPLGKAKRRGTKGNNTLVRLPLFRLPLAKTKEEKKSSFPLWGNRKEKNGKKEKN